MGPNRAISWKKCVDALISEIYTALQFVDEQKRDEVNQEWARAADVGFEVYLFQEVVVKYENLNKRTKNAVGHFERACPDIRRKHAERGKARGRGGRPPARGGTQVGGQGPAPHVVSYMYNYSASPPVPPGYSAMMTAPSFPFMKALGDVENPTFRVGEVLGKAEEGTGFGDS
uniref:Uncharacterized protein n=1 Tax=Chromera velia CCMP2878 TaxID=1169474 RepID=A0A0G4FCI2_9ALVE|eukprot:Cvel_16373.t1-p1 / transcript=Cvel_16373.t1 / gene=Cvel_16373 / organism=Chromera_velia_CCMP2878 / gene_product=hypothetical protein / transcript_product=hypothetical protein / location=Cvel_scaffold1258:47929-48969(+) / protein_length=172 / sequence_SO=supercontig / SO=protein_coding / is_pseudo=false